MTLKKLSFILAMSFGLFSCKEPAIEKPSSYYVFPTTPIGEVPQPQNNVATIEGVALGKALFFDAALSVNGKVSCATCHLPQLAFADGVALSNKGISGKVLERHSPALFNLAWMTGLFWDGGSTSLEAQVFGPLSHPDEMGMDLFTLVNKLQVHPEYPSKFKRVFGSDSISTQRIARVFGQYQRTLLSFDAPYDQWKRGEIKLNDDALEGYKIYQSNCASCHKEGLFTDNLYHNNGLDSWPIEPGDEAIFTGRYRITNKEEDLLKYKTPSLRNLKFTAPFMHDGRLADLDAVIRHYRFDVKTGPTLDSALTRYPQAGIRLSELEVQQLKAFLETLNDQQFINRHNH